MPTEPVIASGGDTATPERVPPPIKPSAETVGLTDAAVPNGKSAGINPCPASIPGVMAGHLGGALGGCTWPGWMN